MTFNEHKGKTISSPNDFAKIIQSILKTFDKINQDKEHFFSIGLDSRNSIKYVEVVSIGTMNASLVHPRELFRRAIQDCTSAIIVSHNHPSGDVKPSEADIAVTSRIKDAGVILGIELLDHIIVSTEKSFCFSEYDLI